MPPHEDKKDHNKKIEISPYIPFGEYPGAPDFKTRLRIMLGRGIENRASYKAFMRSVKEFDTAINVGSRIGSWAIPMSSAFRRVVAFEHDKELFEHLRRNVRNANLKNIRLMEYSIGDKFKADFEAAKKARLLPLDVAVDKVVAPSNKIGAIKIDAEGHEMDILRSGVHTIMTHMPTILLRMDKCRRHDDIRAREVADWLEDMGYEKAACVKNDHIFVPG